MPDYIHCLILIESNPDCKTRNAKKAKGQAAPKRYALLPAVAKRNPFCEILAQNNIQIVKNGEITPPQSLKLDILEVIVDNYDAQTNPGRLYLDRANHEFARQLFSKSANIQVLSDACTTYYYTYYAAEADSNLKAFDTLLAAKVDMTLVHPEGGSLFHFAAGKGYHCRDLMELLLKYGANVNAVREDGAIPLHIAAGKYNYFEYEKSVEILLKNGAYLNAKMKNGSTPLHEAAAVGSIPVVELLLERGAKVDVKAKDGSTPLHKVAKVGSLEVAELLVSNGAKVSAKTKDGLTPIHIVAGLGLGSKYIPVVRLFLQNGADIHATDVKGNTPLLYAVKGLPDVVKLMVESGADINVQNEDGKTALFIAVTGGWPKTYEYILSLNPDVSVEGNRKALHVALRRRGVKYETLVEQMIQQGFTVTAEDINDPDVLFGAIEKHCFEIVQSLLEFGAEVNQYHTFFSLKMTPLRCAIRANQPDLTQLLLEYGADLNAKCGPGNSSRTIVTDAVTFAGVDILKLLVARGLNVQDDPTLFHVAAEKARPGVVQFLIEEGFDWNAESRKGERPLSIALREGNFKAFEVMVKFGAKFDCSSNLSAETTSNPVFLEMLLCIHFSPLKAVDETTISNIFVANLGGEHDMDGCVELLAKHLIKLIAVNESICAKDLVPIHCFKQFRLDDFQSQCTLEVGDMKREKVGCTDVTFYEVLMKSCSQIACCARNQSFVKTLESCDMKSKYPIYGDILSFKIDCGCLRRKLLDQGIKTLGALCQQFSALPHDLKEIVADFLNNQDLLVLRKCLPPKKCNT